MKAAFRQWLTVGLAAAFAAPAWAQAQQNVWIGADSDWLNSNNWTLGVPAAGQDVVLFYDLASMMPFANYAAGGTTPSAPFNSLLLDTVPASPGSQSMLLDHSSGILWTTNLTVGNVGAARYGINGYVGPSELNVGTTAVVGKLSSSVGNISHGEGASVNIGADLILGDAAYSRGTYLLDALSPFAVSTKLTVTGKSIVGNEGDGDFTQFGGTHQTGVLVLGANIGATGHYGMLDGSLTSNSTVVGKEGRGTFDQSGGTHVTGNLVLGQFATGTADYNLGNPTLIGGTIVAQLETSYTTVGQEGMGTFTLWNGTHTTGSLIVGQLSGSSGEYAMMGLGDTKLKVLENAIIGDASYGSFANVGQSTHEVLGDLILGNTQSGRGFYNLSSPDLPAKPPTGNPGDLDYDPGYPYAPGSYLKVSGNTIVGKEGSGKFEQYGESHSTSSLVLGQALGSFGWYSMEPSGVKLQISQNLIVGDQGVGLFGHTGGSVLVKGELIVGQSAGSTGSSYVIDTYIISGGKPVSAGRLESGNVVVGDAGEGSFVNRGVQTVNGDMILGRQSTGKGSYDLDYKDARLDVSGGIFVGSGGVGILNVNRGALTAANMSVNANGTLNYSGGTITLGTSSAPGTLTVATDGQVNVTGTASSGLDFTGQVDNSGKFKITGQVVTWHEKFINGGSYESDPSTNIFMKDLEITQTGYLVGGVGDIFELHGGFLNASTRGEDWDTDLATLVFNGGGGQQMFGVAGAIGSTAFGWGNIMAEAGVMLSFYDSNTANDGMALYVGILDLDGGLDAILVEDNKWLTIYFDQTERENAYLLAALGNEEDLRTRRLNLVGYGATDVPEPGTIALLAIGLASLGAVRRRKH